jgi:hypothetical protein
MTTPLPLKITKKPAMQASKWLECQILVDSDEMAALFEALGHFEIYVTGCVVREGEGWIEKSLFLNAYKAYVDCLKQGVLPAQESYFKLFSSVFTSSSEMLCAVAVGEGRQIIRVQRPVIQLQVHQMGYSPLDGKFRPMVFGNDCIAWGIQFAYPQLFQEPETHLVETITNTDRFPNTALFKTLQRWVRHHTVPTPFVIGDQKINIPIRLGKKCLPWINNHPQLIQKGLKVVCYPLEEKHS